MKKSKMVNRKSQLVIIVSFLLLIISGLLIIYSLSSDYKIEKENDDNISEYFYYQTEKTMTTEAKKNKITTTKKELYKGVLEIKKINLKRGFYNYDSKLNNVNKNLFVLRESKMPDILNGNLIIAAHSGNSKVAFFNRLNELVINDKATIYYENKTYEYKLVKCYEIEKTGEANIIRNINKNTLTLITCKRKTNKQLVFIFELNN